MSALQDELAPRIVPVVLSNLTRHYPYHDAHLMRRDDPSHDPIVAHPAFGNSFDWHSSVHSHWTAVQLLDHFAAGAAGAPHEAAALQGALLENLAADHVVRETSYLAQHPSYERPYGWGWAMMLAAAAQNAAPAPIRERAPQLRRMAEWIAGATADWLNVLHEPVRHGVHSNTAFSLGLMLDAARALGFATLERAIAGRAHAWFESEGDWPERWERSGHDFLSPGLAQADLMRRILPKPAFAAWWNAFLPGVSPESRILSIVDVPEVADGQIVHLHGLNLSRAAMLARIARALPEATLVQQARRLYRASADRALSGDYLATHWLATFAWDAAVSIDRAS